MEAHAMVTFGMEAAPCRDGRDTSTAGRPGRSAVIEGLPAGILSAGSLRCREQSRDAVSSGCPALDALLPAGGVRRGSLLEWMAEPTQGHGTNSAVSHGPATGAVTLACVVAHALARAVMTSSGTVPPRTIVVVDRTGWFHPPAVLPWLGDERRLVVARPSRDDDEIWTIDQALRCTGVAAVLAWPRTRVGRSTASRGSRLGGASQQWSTAMRRWQLAAAGSGAVGLFVRPLAARGEASWAEARIAVSPQAGGTLTERRLRLTLAGGSWSAITADGQHAAEVTLDLARGCAGAPWPAAAVSGRSGVACRAS
jgi:hypothetical protein